MERVYRLVISCPDATGIVAKVSNFLSGHNGWITEANHHADRPSGMFYMRNEIRADSLPFDLEELLNQSDIISIHSPLNEKTLNLIDNSNIPAIKKGTVYKYDIIALGR